MSGEHTETALSGRVPLQVPGFKAAIMPAIVQALEQWKAEAERMATMLVDMERSYITAGFFRWVERLACRQARSWAGSHAAGQAVTGCSRNPRWHGWRFPMIQLPWQLAQQASGSTAWSSSSEALCHLHTSLAQAPSP